jgi:hypothetical protein
MEVPTRLYKYLPLCFADNLLRHGDVLFRNLAYFRKIEDRGRRDLLEGLHMDYPDNPVAIEAPDRGMLWRGRAAFLNSINPERLFVFCLSEGLDDALFQEFLADACVEIDDPSEFIRRCRVAVARKFLLRDSGLLHGRVSYYAPNRAAPIDVTNPKQIAFCKHAPYANQREYRLAVPLKGAFKLTRRIVNQRFSFDEEVAAGVSDERHVTIGSISDIATVHTRLVSVPASSHIGRREIDVQESMGGSCAGAHEERRAEVSLSTDAHTEDRFPQHPAARRGSGNSRMKPSK